MTNVTWYVVLSHAEVPPLREIWHLWFADSAPEYPVTVTGAGSAVGVHDSSLGMISTVGSQSRVSRSKRIGCRNDPSNSRVGFSRFRVNVSS